MRIEIDKQLLKDAVAFACFRYLIYDKIPEQKMLFIKITDTEITLSCKRVMGADTKIVLPVPKHSLLGLRPGRCWVSLVKMRNLMASLPSQVERLLLVYRDGKLVLSSGSIKFHYEATDRAPHLPDRKPDAVLKGNVYTVDFRKK